LSRLLETIDSPADLKRLSIDDLPRLAEELRAEIVQTVSQTGGHLASNLGAVELSIALHYVFESPRDKIVWDVGHQAYAHKLLTGRREAFKTLRQIDGMSGFPCCDESEHDHFFVGHAGTSISSALGLAEAQRLAGDADSRVIAVIGDGSMTAGIAYEGLNQAGRLDRNFIIVLNDNEMSISPNVGAMSGYLSRKFAGATGQAIRKRLKGYLKEIPHVGEDPYRTSKRMEDSVKSFLAPGFLFEALGFEYLGPIDGHDVEALIDAFRTVVHRDHPVLVHIITQKGKGYAPAELNPSAFHGIGKFDMATGEPKKSTGAPPSYTKVFGDALTEMARHDKRIVGITAAMPTGTGMEIFMNRFPDRSYDVGIAEQHAVTFAAGLAHDGFRPVVALYSTFLQRAYDQIVHDVCLQNLPVIFAIDRGGVVGDDGPTHHGAFDLSYLRHIPRLTIMAPANEAELVDMLASAVSYNEPVAVRYPRGNGEGVPLPATPRILERGRGAVMREGDDLTLIAIGNRVVPALHAAQALADEGIAATVIDARFVKPLDEQLLVHWAQKTGRVITVEENARLGGFGAAVLELFADKGLDEVKTRLVGLPDRFIEHGPQETLRHRVGIDWEGILTVARDLLGRR